MWSSVVHTQPVLGKNLALVPCKTYSFSSLQKPTALVPWKTWLKGSYILCPGRNGVHGYVCICFPSGNVHDWLSAGLLPVVVVVVVVAVVVVV